MSRFWEKWIKEKKTGKQPIEEPEQYLSKDLKQNIHFLQSIYADCEDVVFRTFFISKTYEATLIYIEGLSNVEEIDKHILTPLMNEKNIERDELPFLLESKTPISKTKKIFTMKDCINYIAFGAPVLLVDGENEGFIYGLFKWEKRSIEEPTAEVGIKGPREGFTETLTVNISQVRRIIKSPALKMKSIRIGDYTQTNIMISYVEGLADQTLIEEVTNRIKRIKMDGILESSYIEEMIEDNPYSPFPQILNTERPDVVCSNLLEGRVAIFVEGSPFVLVAPATFFNLVQSHEDYYQRFFVGTFIRWLRYLFMAVAIFLPSLYVAVLTFHAEMVPTSLLLSMAASREPVPFPAIIEVLIMEVSFEALREAGVRLPKQVGAAVSIVGALVIGQAAVQAGLVSAPMVIVVAITGIASFMIPRYALGTSFRMLRFPMILLGGSLGLLGIMLGFITVVIHLCTLRSFGVPYLTPLAPLKGHELKDTLVRSPWWMLNSRPHLTGEYNQSRQAPHMKPSPEKGGE